MPTPVVIFFAGLALWAQLPADPVVHVILPRVHWQNARSTNQTSTHAHTTSVLSNTPIVEEASAIGLHVENHVAALITYTDSFPNPFPTDWSSPVQIGTSGFSYVLLNDVTGTQLRFVTQGANPSLTTITPLLPRLNNVPTLDRTVAYPRASAIFNLPVGRMKSCLSLTRIGKPRLDTQLDLSTTEDLIVLAQVGERTKQLHIKRRPQDSKIVLVVANVPKRYLDGDYREEPPNPLERMSHVNAFYALTSSSCIHCTEALKLWFDTHMEELDMCASNDLTALEPPQTQNACAYPNPDDTLAAILQGANYMCSNEGWP